MKLQNLVYPVYGQILSSDLLNLSAVETKATCDNCLRSRDQRFEYTYDKSLKCCTFWPMIPNFAVGGLLSASHKDTSVNLNGLETIRSKIENEFALPLAVVPHFKYQHEFLKRKPQDFGRREDLLCPYYDTTREKCGIWSYRGVVCTTFYCRSDAGPSGLKFWSTLNDYLSYVEISLAEECLVQLDFSPRDISDQLAYLNKQEFTATEKVQMKIPSKDLKKLWNGYADKTEFYKKCFQIIGNLSKKEFKTIMGQMGQQLEQKVYTDAERRRYN